ncbi:MAG: M16 family metallopeptidase [Cyclobacteriaceae bacterium]
MNEFDVFSFKNGLRAVYKQNTITQLFHCGFVLDIGSRDEKEHQLGLAHFWEHMAFKGTKKRKAFHILNRLESVGGEINAYTTKEKIYFYASVLSKHHDRAIELLTDILFYSTFPENETNKERHVILEEMAMYNDMPEEAIVDEFEEVIFKNHSLGKNILGTKESVLSFKSHDFSQFLKENLNSEKIIFSAVGNLSKQQFEKSVSKHLEKLPTFSAQPIRSPFNSYAPSILEKKKSSSQAHCAIGTIGLSLHHKDRLPLFMLINILGGSGLTSRLNMALRERKGYVYSVDASTASYTDTGMISLFFGTEEKTLYKSIKLVYRELEKLQSKPLGTIQLSQAKEQLMGQLVMSEERNVSLMQMMGKSLLDLNKIDSLDSVLEEIKQVSATKLCDLANTFFNKEQLSQLIYLPNNN